MTSDTGPKQKRIDRYIDQNLKKVFSDLQKDEMPDEIVDLLSVLRAQDKELKGNK
ncbi:NepR family anti-sigma factor [Yoonia algicola]|uniref:NepR family anti-sigma factor n=1 Tax=Yoonia algicola TaxID=3137368 RepID=A0AAN0M2J6_9RHOB